ncbi:helix-turn-helix domain-containing protein [candidate division WOR-3 bacterium]|nr:helix-turn-helix domain-containing protein [candidate division WOR-3 bacterium]
MKHYDADIKLKAVKHYLGGSTLEKCAGQYRIHRNTIWRWVKKYRSGGAGALTDDIPLYRHWKRLPEEVEERVIALKEKTPGMTVRKARRLLMEKGVQISLKSIWSAWQRYGLTGFARKELSHSYDDFLGSVVSPALLNEIRALIDQNELQQAADIVNALPLFPYNSVILKIPSRVLSLRRQVNRIRAEFAAIPLAQYRRKSQTLRRKLKEHGMNYSSLWVMLGECYALMWSGQPGEVLPIVAEAKNLMKGMRDARLRFFMLLLEGQANGVEMRICKAQACVNQCKVIARTSRNPHFFIGGVGAIYSTMGYYREALRWTDKALQGAAPSFQRQFNANIAQFYGTAGDYRAAFRALKKAQLDDWGFKSRAGLIQLYAHLDQGDFQQAQAFAVETLMRAKKEGVRSMIHPVTLILASCHRASGDVKKAKQLIKEIVPLLDKYNLKQEYWQRNIILDDIQLPEEVVNVPSLQLAFLLRRAQQSLLVSDYRAAYTYAQRKKVLGIFMRLIPFFPEPILRMQGRGQDTCLPRTFLDMPVFRIDAPVFDVRFLGKIRVQRRGEPARRVALGPKDSAFLIHMALNKNKRTPLKDLYDNFWRNSTQPARNLSHLLTRLRKNLAVPSHSVRIQAGTLYWDIYFSTDYEHVKEHLAKARFYEQAGEQEYARREYKRAFHWYRGDPFKGMYDDWSERVRRSILNTVEVATVRYEELNCVKV